MATRYQAIVEAKLAGASIQNAIEAQAKNARLTISNVSVNTGKLVSAIQAELNRANFRVNVSGIGAQIGSTIGAQIQRQVQSSLNNIHLVNGGIGNIGNMLQGAGFDKKSISAVTQELNRMSLTIEKIKTTQLSNGNIKMNIQGVDQLGRAVSILREFDKETGKVVNTSKSFTQSFASHTKAVDQAAEAEKKAAEAAKKYAAEQKKAAQEQLTLTKSGTLSNKIEAWMNNNAKAAERYREQLARIRSELNGNKDSGTLTRLNAEFTQIQSAARAAGLVTNTFATSLKNVGLQVLGLGSAYQIAMKIINTVKQGVNTVVELDTALVDLRKTTTMSDSDLVSFYRDANKEAKNLGVTTKDIIQTAANWSRLGYSNKRDATMMSRYAAQFAAISPGMDIEQSTSGLVSVMKAFHIETDDVLDGIMSKINIVGNNFAVNNADIIDGMSRMSAAMSVMGQDVDSTIALFTAANEVLQNSATTSTALRSMSLRIRGFDEETEMLSDDLVNITGKIIDLTKTASKPGGVSIFTDASQTKYKDLVDYFRELSEIWDEMSAKNKNQLLNDLFGKRGAQAGAAIIKNFSAVEDALKLMQNSAGDADREMSIIMDSLEYKLNALKETGVGIWQNLFPREGIGNAIDGLTAFADVLEKITGFLGPGGTLLAAGGIAGITALIQNFGQPSEGSLNSEIFKLAYYGQEHAVMVA